MIDNSLEIIDRHEKTTTQPKSLESQLNDSYTPQQVTENLEQP